MKNWPINIILIAILVVIVLNMNWRIKDKILEIRYDLTNENKRVVTKQEIDSIYSELINISFNELDSEYLNYTKSNELRYENLVKRLKYVKVGKEQLNKRIVGKFRLKEFICKDDYYQDCIFNKREEVVCILNPKIFHKTLELIEELGERGYNKDGFIIVNGHRHPRFNEELKGAKLSRHIKGEAVDIIVKDVNNDGYEDKLDKDIILGLLENKIIRNEGGIGLYPGTQTVHYDVRGTKARWNTY